MSVQTPIHRARIALPLALAIALLMLPWLLPSAAAPVAVLPKVTELGCDLAQAVAGGRARNLQLPGDLPLHLRLRISCSARS